MGVFVFTTISCFVIVLGHLVPLCICTLLGDRAHSKLQYIIAIHYE